MGNHVVVETAGYELEVTRVANIIADADDEGQYIQVAKVVDHAWLVGSRRRCLLAMKAVR